MRRALTTPCGVQTGLGDNAQEELDVGIGALAGRSQSRCDHRPLIPGGTSVGHLPVTHLVGRVTSTGSTVMLLTIPWGLSILGGRVNLDDKGVPVYK